MSNSPKIHLVKLNGMSILEQLQLEEALIRTDQRNFCLVNTGTMPAIVMGISGDFNKLINQEKFNQKPVPVIKRYSGGGTVFINQETCFISFICNSEALSVPSYPQPIFKWSETFYHSIFSHFGFSLKENDYVIGEKKFGGNAQYLQKNRWLHHTSLLFDYDEEEMEYLLIPEKTPAYRKKREHSDFLCKLNAYFPSKQMLLEKVEISLKKQFDLEELNLLDILPHLLKPHRKTTTTLQI